MTRLHELDHCYVEFIPKHLDEGMLYISTRFRTASHLCCCGCGQKVVTPLNPAKWQLQDHGSTVSLSPSVGLGALPCRSHYWIRRSRIQWLQNMSDAATELAQEADRYAAEVYTGERRIREPSFSDLVEGLWNALVAFVRRLWR